MGTLRNGLLGNYKGKIGNLVFYEVNGKQLVRTVGKSSLPPTTKQLQNRAEMGAVTAFMKPLKEFISIGFAAKAKGTTKTANNMAVSYNKLNAVSGAYPDVTIDYSKVLVTQGNINGADDAAVELTATGLSFTWLCPNSIGWERPNDQVMLLAYFPRLEKAEYLLYGARRSQCAAILNLPADLTGKPMHVYISFIAEDRKKIANSIYLGGFNQA